MQNIFEEAKVPIVWDIQHIGKEVDPRTNSMVTRENLDSVLVRRASRGKAVLRLVHQLLTWEVSAGGRGAAGMEGREPH